MSTTKKKATDDATLNAPQMPARTSKIGTVVAMLRRPEGADVTALMGATGWQNHSVRGAIAGHIKKKLNLAVATTKEDGKTIYRIGA